MTPRGIFHDVTGKYSVCSPFDYRGCRLSRLIQRALRAEYPRVQKRLPRGRSAGFPEAVARCTPFPVLILSRAAFKHSSLLDAPRGRGASHACARDTPVNEQQRTRVLPCARRGPLCLSARLSRPTKIHGVVRWEHSRPLSGPGLCSPQADCKRCRPPHKSRGAPIVWTRNRHGRHTVRSLFS